MSNFRRTRRVLDREGSWGWLAQAFLALALLGLWGAWFAYAQVAVYVASDSGRVVAEEESHAIQAPVAGRVVEVNLALQRAVERGEVLYRLDSAEQEGELDREQRRLANLQSQLEVARARLAAEGVGVGQAAASSDAEVAEQQAELIRAQAVLAKARSEFDSTQALFDEGIAPDQELNQKRTAVEEAAAKVTVVEQRINFTDRRGATEGTDRQTNLQEQRMRVTQLEGEIAEAEAAIRRFRREIDERTFRAPVAGEVAQLDASVAVGSFVEEAQNLGAIVPRGGFKVVAGFPPPSLGRVFTGQSARVRLEGFPSLQYGSLRAIVERVGSEIDEGDGLVRIELALDTDDAGIELSHGLVGTVEVEVERVSPATLVLRAAGRLVGRPTRT